MELSEAQVQRYSRHILLPDVGGVGQKRLLAAAVSVDVSMPAAATAAVYLAAAGVGTIHLAGDVAAPVTDDDLRGGIGYGAVDRGAPRGDALAARLRAVNPDVRVAPGGGGVRVPVDAAAADTASALIAAGAAATRAVAAIARGAATP
jgi:adenylyltransferase/sulfurtransferase